MRKACDLKLFAGKGSERFLFVLVGKSDRITNLEALMEPGVHQAFVLFFRKFAFLELDLIHFCCQGMCLIDQQVALGIIDQNIFLVGSLRCADIFLLLQGFLCVRVPPDCGNQFVIIEPGFLIIPVHGIDKHRRCDAQAREEPDTERDDRKNRKMSPEGPFDLPDGHQIKHRSSAALSGFL